MKNIFLAIDGVLNSEAFFLTQGVAAVWWDRPWTRSDIDFNIIDRFNYLWDGPARPHFTHLYLLPSWRFRSVSSKRIKTLMASLALHIPVEPLMEFNKDIAVKAILKVSDDPTIIIDSAPERYSQELQPYLFKVDRCVGFTKKDLRALEERICK